MFPVEYEAHVWNEIFKKEEIVHGITFGEDFADAMYNIEHYYGDDIISIKLYMLEETNFPVYEFEINSNGDCHGMLKFGTVEIYDGY